jgi:hypothetical protein
VNRGMRTARTAAAAGVLGFLLGTASPARPRGQEEALVGFLAQDRIVSLAVAADPFLSSFAPAPAALASMAALVDPVHIRMFLRASRPDDLKLAAKICRSVEAAANAAFSAEFVGVSDDLSEPKALVSESGVTGTPEVIIYWLGTEVGRMRPQPGSAVEDELAAVIHQARAQVAQEMLQDDEFFRNVFHSDLPLDCTRCHLGTCPGRDRENVD